MHSRCKAPPPSTSLHLIGFKGCTLHLVVRLRGGGGPPIKYAELGIAPGGLIKQCILEDPYPESTWDIDRAISFNVQILNSQLFQQITGIAPPDTPISAQTYASHGLPFFDIYNETSMVEGDFGDIKSVAAMDIEKSPIERESDSLDEHDEDDEPTIENPVTLLNPDGTQHRFKPVSVLKAELKRLNYAQF